ncbi:hypothetical protein Glove_39g7 [Diversispora epigaea]|uniref:DUF659 domain-containing protein n=2 Tax=Diversispora epigaea TaxID=1348612 RepID=A0A397JGQ7_9GLOM|nr:hypothetical protein Glove_39g7 [Diversispora epigaea]
MPLPVIIEEFIIKTNEKINKSNYKIYCKPCVKVLGEIEGKKTSFPNKKDRLIIHFKKCINFFNETTPEKREEIFNLLQKNNTNSTNLQIESFSCETTSTVSQGSKMIVRSSSYRTIDNYIVNKPEAEELFQFLNPHLKLPDRHLLGDHILSDAVEDSNNTMIKVLQEDPTFDGWTNVRNEHLLDVVIITSEGRSFVWKATNISSERENHKEVIEKIQEMFIELNNDSIKVCAVVTDSTGPYAASRCRLRIIKRAIVFFPCFAHQVNLCIGEIFKESIEFKEMIDKAIRLASFFRNSNNKYFISKLKDQQYEEYNKYFAIVAPGETQWNSYYYVCTSILKTQKALQILAIKFEPPVVETRRRTGDEPTLKRDIYEIIGSAIFWKYLKLLTEILYPYCKILDRLQSDKVRLHEVIHSFDYISQFWNENSDSNLTTRLITRLEKRWKEWEQPILIIACLLHPNYHMKIFNNININYTTIGSWLGYYYSTWNQFNGDIYRYWSFACASTNELGFVACRIFGICVNAASNTKALEMSKLRADITYNHQLQKKVLEITTQTIISEIELSRCYETKQIITDENNEDEQTNEQDDEEIPIYESQNSFNSEEINEEIEITNIEENNNLEDDFGNYLQEWINMLEEEKKSMEELEEIDDDEAENITHPN